MYGKHSCFINFNRLDFESFDDLAITKLHILHERNKCQSFSGRKLRLYVYIYVYRAYIKIFSVIAKPAIIWMVDRLTECVAIDLLT